MQTDAVNVQMPRFNSYSLRDGRGAIASIMPHVPRGSLEELYISTESAIAYFVRYVFRGQLLSIDHSESGTHETLVIFSPTDNNWKKGMKTSQL